MAYLIRKFHRAWWEPDKELPESIDGLTADAITRCLNTKSNRLSVWKAESSGWGDFDDVLAALFSSLDGPSRSDIIVLTEEKICEIDGVVLDSNAGETPADTETNAKHRDISGLNHYSITKLAEIILEELRKGDQGLVKRYKEKEVIEIVKKYVEEQKIDASALKDRWRIKLGL